MVCAVRRGLCQAAWTWQPHTIAVAGLLLLPLPVVSYSHMHAQKPHRGAKGESVHTVGTHKAVHAQKPYRGANGEPVYTVGKPFQRDQPASWDFLMENLYATLP